MSMLAILSALLLLPAAAQPQPVNPAAAATAVKERLSAVTPTMSGGGKVTPSESASKANVAPGHSLTGEDPKALAKKNHMPELGSSTYPLPAPVYLTINVVPGAESDGVTISPGAHGFQMRTIFRSKEREETQISVEIFGEFNYFDDEPRVRCKGMYAIESRGRYETFDFERQHTFLKWGKPMVLHEKDGRSILLSASLTPPKI